MKIKPLFIPLKDIKRIKHTHTVSAHSGNFQRMTNYQAWQNVGLRSKVYDADDLCAMYDQCEEFWKTVQSRLITSVLLVDPTYAPRRATMATAGDKFSDIRHNLRMAIRGLWKAYATRNWEWVSTYAVKINREYLAHYRALHGEDVKYYNHENIACGDTFIEPKDRTLFGRRKQAHK